jgi:alcohol dehydrogenase class IV
MGQYFGKITPGIFIAIKRSFELKQRGLAIFGEKGWNYFFQKYCGDVGKFKWALFCGHNSININRNRNPQLEKFLKSQKISVYRGITSNPRYEEILDGANFLMGDNFDGVISIGGGSVMDFTKASLFYFNKWKKRGDKLIHVAVPTTFATGSQATQFATYYREGKKYSLDENWLLPHLSIVDCRFINFLPPREFALGAIDSLSHGIESFWSVKSGVHSQDYAELAIHLLLKNKNYLISRGRGIGKKSEGIERERELTIAGHLAGNAINITRTTACHSLSYFFTGRFDIPHGAALAVFLPKVYQINKEFDGREINDPGGLDSHRLKMVKLEQIIGKYSKGVESVPFLSQFIQNLGLSLKFSQLGLKNLPGDSHRDLFKKEANHPLRMNNNPVVINAKDRGELFESSI